MSDNTMYEELILGAVRRACGGLSALEEDRLRDELIKLRADKSERFCADESDRGIIVGKFWPRPPSPCNLVPNWDGEFKDFDDWVSFASQRLCVAEDSNGRPLSAMCVDMLGRRCVNGRDFMRARDEDTFPVRYFWDCKNGE